MLEQYEYRHRIVCGTGDLFKMRITLTRVYRNNDKKNNNKTNLYVYLK